MNLHLHDTLSGETRPFVPCVTTGSGSTACGPTVYGFAHIGNFRFACSRTCWFEYLRWQGQRVTWVMNVTDIDDKIIRGAAVIGEPIDALAGRYLDASCRTPRRCA